MSGRIPAQFKSPIPLAMLAGGFVWIVFDSVFFGMLTAAATFVLSRRDQRSETARDSAAVNRDAGRND